MKNKNSLAAFYDKNNQKRFSSHRAKIVRCLNKHEKLTRRQISFFTGLNEWQVGRRLSEIDFVSECGSINEFGNSNSLWSLNKDLIR